ncbi:MarR family transcriptional regulator [Rhodococcus sp. IITR03]|nr:MarR family transcriptional regulator [Rhodococcus sp. IITR03]
MQRRAEDTADSPFSRRDELDFLASVEVAVGAIAQRKPDADPKAARMVLQLTRVADVVAYDIESRVHRPHGWSWSGFRVLFALWVAGPLESRQVTRMTGMSRAGVSALVKTLERDGLLVRTRAATDRRTIELALTQHGEHLVDQVLDEHHEREKLWADALTPNEQVQLAGLLDKLSRAATDLGANTRE